MIITIPLNGLGQRFANLGYYHPKPLIKVLGKEIILHLISSLKLKDEKVLLICNKNIQRYRFEDLIRKHFDNPNISIVYLEENTRGAAETILLGLKNKNIPLDESLLIIDGDTIFNRNVIDITNANNDKNIIFYNNNMEINPIYSYIDLKENNVVDIVEKEKISDNICVGAYYFRSVKEFNEITEFLIQNNIKQKEEYYISGVFKEFCNRHIPIIGERIDNYHCLGTPVQLQNYTLSMNADREYRFVIDIDNTIQTYPLQKGDYSTVQPINEMIQFVRNIKAQGHYVILYTARRMKTHKGDVVKVVNDIKDITVKTLAEMQIPYDELIFGKPQGDFYIDDLAINCFHDIQKLTGFYFNTVESRPYHIVNIQNDIVTKQGSLEGEYFWYKHVPEHIRIKYFPEIIENSSNKIIMKKIQGMSLSHIYVGNMLNDSILNKIFTSLEEIHSVDIPSEQYDKTANYTKKLIERWQDNKELYNSLHNSHVIYDELLEFFKTYSPTEIKLVHGDPVFSNTFFDIKNNIKFIDVRGKQGDVLSLSGDVLYDWAKVYQSLCGYDYILLNERIDIDNVNKFKSIFKYFKKEQMLNIRNITKSLLFSLLPLHSDKNKIKQYYDLIKTV